jgi:hypothetical protein
MKLGQRHWRLALVLSVVLVTAVSRAAGPGFFNATDDPVSLRVKLAEGPDALTLDGKNVTLPIVRFEQAKHTHTVAIP